MSGENGISINRKISETNVKFLIDTGSAVTLLSKDIFKVIDKDSRIKLEDVPFK